MSTTAIFGHLSWQYLAENMDKANCILTAPSPEECQNIPTCSEWPLSAICHPLEGHSSCDGGFMYYHPNSAEFPRTMQHIESIALNKSGRFLEAHLDRDQCEADVRARQDYLTTPTQELSICAFDQNLDCREFVYPLTRPCCPGFMCPQGIPCMIPCDEYIGGYCPSTVDNVTRSDACDDRDGAARGCGGTEKVKPCPTGSYCPSASVRIVCPEGHYCPIGATAPIKCGVGYDCPAESSQPGSAAFMIVLIVAIVMTFLAFRFREFIMRSIGRFVVGERADTEEVEIQWEGEEQDPDVNFSSMLGLWTDIVPNQKRLTCEEFASTVLNPLDFTMDLKFTDLTVKLHGSGKKVVNHVTGRVPAGVITAIMGPSGAGKTSFVFGLTGKAKQYANVTGTVLVNGKEEDVSKFKKYIGFVPQNDVMNPHMTVREILKHNAALRLPKSTTSEYRNDLVNSIIAKLGLWDHRKTVIGDEKQRGLSGGQKKRVNIAMELVAEPSLLILDEPTSGLDAATSLTVMKVLKEIAARGTNVIIIIHQPRIEIFRQLDNVFLFGVGGTPVYLGEEKTVLPYFSSLGYTISDSTNPGDFVIDAMTGFAAPKNVAGNLEKLNSALNRRGATHKDNRESASETAAFLNRDEPAADWNPDALFYWWKVKSSRIELCESANMSKIEQTEFVKRQSPNVFEQILRIFKRSIIVSTRQYLLYITDIVVVVFSALLAAFISSPSDFAKSGSNAWVYSMMAGLASGIASVKLFGTDKLSFFRESSAGISKSAYFLSQTMVSAIWIFVHSTMYLAALFFFAIPNGRFSELWVVTVLIVFVAQGLGQLISVWVDFTKATLLAVVVIVMFTFGSGLDPSLKDLESTGAGKAFATLNPFRYTLEALWIVETKNMSPIYQIGADAMADHMGWDRSRLSADINMALVLGFTIRAMVWISMYVADRSKKI